MRMIMGAVLAAMVWATGTMAASLTWSGAAGGAVGQNWNTVDANWNAAPGTTYNNGDTVTFNHYAPGPGPASVYIGTSPSTPANVAPATVIFVGGYGNAWTFTGGDIDGASTVLNMNQDNAANFDRNASYTFGGGANLNASGVYRYRPPTATGHLQLGTNVVRIGGGGAFYFEPGIAGAVMSNNFTVAAGGGTLSGNSIAAFCGTVSMAPASGALTANGRSIFSGLLFSIAGSGTITIPNHYSSASWGKFDGVVTAGGTGSVTINNAGGTPSDYYAEITSAGGWNVSNAYFTGGQHTIVPNSGTFFSGVKANGGKVYIQGVGLVVPSTGNNGNSPTAKSGTYNVAADHVVSAQLRAATINIVSNSTVSGTGTLYANNVYVGTGSAGTLAPGANSGTLTVNANLIVDSAAAIDCEFSVANQLGGAGNDLLVVTNGNLTINGGTVNVRRVGGEGTYTLATYSGALGGSGSLTVGAIPEHTRCTLSIDTLNKRVNLSVAYLSVGGCILLR